MSRLRWGLVPVVILASLVAAAGVFGSSKPKANASASDTLTILSQLALKPGTDNMIAGFKKAVEGKGIELVDVRGDDVDFARARSNVDDVLAGNPEINCMVGFYSYNPPKIFEALQAAGKLGQITVIAFDEDPITLGAVRDGSFAGTVVQQPFEWGYRGMLLMAKYLEGDKSGIPENKLIIVPTKIIDKSNVDAFWTELKTRQCKK